MAVRIPEDVRRDLLHVCRRLYDRGLVAGTDGNVSVRVEKNAILATPTGMSKGFLGSDDLVVCDLDGKQISGKRRLTTEIKIHLAVYSRRDDVCAVVHAHPPYATAFAVANKAMNERIMPEAYIAVGHVALTAYGTPSTEELEESIRPVVADHNAILLANHGAMALGRDVIDAYHRMEALEQLARISALTELIGGARTLTPEEIARLEAIRDVYGHASTNVPCYRCGWSPTPSGAQEAQVAQDAALGTDARASVIARPVAYTEPNVHWPGNPPVWERHAATDQEAQVRDLARRALREVRENGT